MAPANSPRTRSFMSKLTDTDIYHFREGTFFRAYEKLGAHVEVRDGVSGTSVAVWAPSAHRVTVIGDFNGWNTNSHPLQARADHSGIWEGFLPGLGHGTLYKLHIDSNNAAYSVDKSDPY